MDWVGEEGTEREQPGAADEQSKSAKLAAEDYSDHDDDDDDDADESPLAWKIFSNDNDKYYNFGVRSFPSSACLSWLR